MANSAFALELFVFLFSFFCWLVTPVTSAKEKALSAVEFCNAPVFVNTPLMAESSDHEKEDVPEVSSVTSAKEKALSVVEFYDAPVSVNTLPMAESCNHEKEDVPGVISVTSFFEEQSQENSTEENEVNEKEIKKNVKQLRASVARQIAVALDISGKINGKKRDITAVKEDILLRWLEAPELVSTLAEKVVSTSLAQHLG